jgi:hypothetical protein
MDAREILPAPMKSHMQAALFDRAACRDIEVAHAGEANGSLIRVEELGLIKGHERAVPMRIVGRSLEVIWIKMPKKQLRCTDPH